MNERKKNDHYGQKRAKGKREKERRNSELKHSGINFNVVHQCP
jgi:hypothetical protein